MAGHGSRFANAGFNTPKPLIPVAGQPMLQRALQSLEGVNYQQLIFIALEEHQKAYNVTQVIKNIAGASAQVLLIPQVTQGQMCTVMAAESFIDNPTDLLIIASDTYVQSPLGQHIAQKPQHCHGIISTFDLPGNRWSFAKTNAQGRVVQVAEKERISPNASTGLYYFSSGQEYMQVARHMMARQLTTRGEYYVIPMYQQLIEAGKLVTISTATQMWDMGTPQAKAAYEAHLAQNPQ